MPVSSPSYFPPSRGTDQIVGITAGKSQIGARVFLAGQNAGNNSTAADLIIIGHNAGAGGVFLSTQGLSSSIVLGHNTLSSSFPLSGDPVSPGILCVGNNILPNYGGLIPDCTIIGNNTLTLFSNDNETATINNTTVLGHHAVDSTTNFGNANIVKAVIIGDNCVALTDALNITQSTLIGSNSLSSGGVDNTSLSNITSSIIIGTVITPKDASTIGVTLSVILGNSNVIRSNPQPGPLVIIGHNNECFGIDTILIGTNCVSGTAGVCIGNNQLTGTNARFNNIIIGNNAGSVIGLPSSIFDGQVLIADDEMGSILWASLSTGNCVIGSSSLAQREDADSATNTLKLINGTKGTTAPIGGISFYVNAGVLHCVDSANNDTTLSTIAGQLAASSAQDYTNNSATATGTLTNAPVAGNPTKWIPINDNGTIRNIPSW